MSIRSIAVDDEPSSLDVISIHAAKIPELDLVARFTDPFKALEFLRNERIDLVFLDINMPGLSGMELIGHLKCPPRIVFTTAYSEYALDSYEFEAVDYLLKPIEFDRFYRSVQRYQKQVPNGNGSAHPALPRHIFVKDGYKQVQLLVDEITYIRSEGNYLNIYNDSGRTVARMTLTQMAELVPEDLFIRVHNSYLVNIAHIEKIENNHIHCRDAVIPIGEKFKEGFFRRIGNYDVR